MALVGSSQSWEIASKGTFPFDRVIVKVVTGGPTGGKVAKAVFKCQGTGEEVTSVAPKRVEPNTSAGGVVSYDEVWSANFATKCVDTDNNGNVVPSGVNVTLEPVDPTNKLVIKQALVQNTQTLVPQESAVNVARILNGPPSAWKITIKDTTKGYDRVDLVVTTARIRTPRFALFFCSSSHELAFGTFKQQLPTANQELWSANFRRKCSNSVLVLFLGFDRRNQVVIKSGRASNTTHLIPREAPANATLKAKTQTFKLTSKATFDADRVDVEVGTAQNTPKVRSAVFVCHNPGLSDEKVIGTSKGIVDNANPVGDSLPNHEIWSAEFSHKCILADGSVTVILSPLDPNNQLVIKAAFVENTSTPTPPPTPIPGSSPCVKVAQNVPFPHNLLDTSWDAWKCAPSDPALDWNRVDIYVVNPGPNVKLSGVQFDCQDNFNASAHTGTKAGIVTLKSPPGDPAAPPGQEIWSGEGFVDPTTGVAKNCTGGVNVLIQPAVATNHPIIKEAIFSHVGPEKTPTPTPNVKPACPVAPDLAFPEPGCDQQAATIDMVVEIADPPLGVLTCSLAGDISIARGAVVVKQQQADGTVLVSVDTRIFFGKLVGTCDPGSEPVTLQFKPSAGRIDMKFNPLTNVFGFPASSFFDVFFNVDTPIGTLHNNDPARVTAEIDRIPPKGSTYRETSSVLLYDSTGRVVGKLVQGSSTLSTPTPKPAS